MAAAGTREGSRRQHERATVEIRVDLSPDSTARFVSATSCNASEGGVFVATDALLRVDTRVKVGFMPDDGQEPMGAVRGVDVGGGEAERSLRHGHVRRRPAGVVRREARWRRR